MSDKEHRPRQGGGAHDHTAGSAAINTSVPRSADSVRASIQLDRLLCPPRRDRTPSTFGLTIEELLDERDTLRRHGGRDALVIAPWSSGEIARVLDLGGCER